MSPDRWAALSCFLFVLACAAYAAWAHRSPPYRQEHDALRARIEALADEWERRAASWHAVASNHGSSAVAYAMLAGETDLHVKQLRAALDPS